MATIFVSYSWDSDAHRTWVRKLVSLIEGEGHTIWFDHRNLGPGEDSESFMKNGILEAEYVLVISTANYTDRFESGTGGVGFEGKWITTRWNKSTDRSWLIPVIPLTSSAVSMPGSIRSVIAADLREGSGYLKQLMMLKQRLRNKGVFSWRGKPAALEMLEEHIIQSSWLISKLTKSIQVRPRQRGGRGPTPILSAIGEALEEGQFVFCESDDLAFDSGEINAVALSSQKWAGSGDEMEERIREKQLRNAAHATRNPWSVMLYKQRDDDEAAKYWGFSHVIPLTRVGKQRYCRGKISDNDFGPENIAEVGDDTSALLLFSIGVHPGRRVLARRRDDQGVARFRSALLPIKAICYHIWKLAQVQRMKSPIHLVAQTERDKLRSLLSACGFRPMDNATTADGLEILEVRAIASELPS